MSGDNATLPPPRGGRCASGVTALPRGVLCLLVVVVFFGLVFALSGMPWVGQAVYVAGGLLFLSFFCTLAPRARPCVGFFYVIVFWLSWGVLPSICFSAPAFVGWSAPCAPG